jgi:hypothetical protein
MANTLNLGTDGNWGVKKDSLLAYNSENGNFKPLPFDFTRASSATVVNKDGLIETVGSGEPRIDFKDDANGALLLEPQRSNLLIQSSDFTSSEWTKSNLTLETNSIVSPDGTLTATKLLETTTSLAHLLYDEKSGTTPNSSYNFNIFVKKLNRRYVGIQSIAAASQSATAFFDLDNGVLLYTFATGTGYSVSNAKIEEYSNGWYRLSATFTTPTSVNYPNICLADSEWTTGSSYNNYYTGDVTKGIYVWGGQYEQGSYATSYIPTQGSVVTRVADACNNGGNEQVINSTEGVLYAQISTFSTSGSAGLISLSDATISNRVTIELDGANIKVRFIVGGSSIGIFNYAANITDISKIAAKFSENYFALWVNGTERVAITSGSIFSTNTLSELSFDRGDDGEDFYGNVKDVRVYNTALTDSELAALTKI